MAAILNFGSLPSSIRRCPRCQVNVGHTGKFGGRLWNRVAISYRLKVISSSGLVAAILNRSSTTSGDVDVVIVRSAMVENVGVTIGIMSVYCWKLKLHRPTEKSSIFPRRVPLVFQVAPGNGKSYVHAENVKTSGIGPTSKRL